MKKHLLHSAMAGVHTNLFASITILLFVLYGQVLPAQNVSINTDGSPPDSSAILDISADNKGVLIPRVALTGTDDTTTIVSPQISLFVYNTATTATVTPGYYHWDGNAWSRLSTMWKQDSLDIYYNEGNVGIGTQAPAHLLEVIGNPGADFTPIAYFENTCDTVDGEPVDGVGVMGVSDRADRSGFGVYGRGGLVGVRGRVFAADTFTYFGVAGAVTGGSGSNFGVLGTANGDGNNIGVDGTSHGPDHNIGVQGFAWGGQTNYAIFGSAQDTSATSQTYAGFFEGDVHISDRLGIGVHRPIEHKLTVIGESGAWHQPIAYFENTTDTVDGELADAYGVMGVCDRSDWAGYGGIFRGGYVGVRGEVFPTDTFTYFGVRGLAIGGAGSNYAVHGYAEGDGASIGVRGRAEGPDANYGVWGYATGGVTNYAVRGYVDTSGVQGTYAGYFVGDTYISGDVGIGTETPDHTFELATQNRVATIYLTTHRDDGGYLAGSFVGRSSRGTQENPSSTMEGDQLASFGGKGYGNTGFGSPPPNGRMGINAAEDYSDSTKGSYILFSTTQIGQSTTAERMRINDNGNIGIGTSSPASPLHLYSEEGAGILRLQSSFNGNDDRGTIEWFTEQNTDTWAAKIGPSTHADDMGLVLATNSPGDFGNQKDIIFKTSDNERMRIKSNGRVGIGTNNPGVRLEVEGETWLNSETMIDDNLVIGRTSFDNHIQFRGTSGNSIFKMFPGDFWLQTDSGVKTRIASGDEFRIQTYDAGYQDRLLVKSTGEVGLGTTNPHGDFQINDHLVFQRTSSDLDYVIANNLHYTAGWKYLTSEIGSVLSLDDNGGFGFGTAPVGTAGGAATITNRLYIANNGNVGIGTTTPGHKLDISGDLNYTGTLRKNGAPVSFTGDFSDGGESANTHRTMGNTDNYDLGLMTNGAERLHIKNDGMVGIGTTAPAAMLDVADTINTGGLKMTTGASNGHVLTSDASGNASWQAPPVAGLVPIGAILPWAKSISGVPALPAGFVECSGQTLSDAGSLLNGQTIPDMNGRFLRGATASGNFGGSDTHSHTGNTAPTSDPPVNAFDVQPSLLAARDDHTHSVVTDASNHLPSYYEVVWIMRVK